MLTRGETAITYQAKFNRECRQWDVVDENDEIVAMFGGGKRGQEQATRSAERMTKLEATMTEAGA
jgi:hypothetical protein